MVRDCGAPGIHSVPALLAAGIELAREALPDLGTRRDEENHPLGSAEYTHAFSRTRAFRGAKVLLASFRRHLSSCAYTAPVRTRCARGSFAHWCSSPYACLPRLEAGKTKVDKWMRRSALVHTNKWVERPQMINTRGLSPLLTSLSAVFSDIYASKVAESARGTSPRGATTTVDEPLKSLASGMGSLSP